VTDQALSLFGDLQPDTAPAPKHPGPYVGVALEQGIDRVLDYAVPAKWRAEIQVGQRVRVPLGRNNRPQFGYVVSLKDTSDYATPKKILEIDDPRVLVGPKVMELVQWMSRYYVTPVGTVLDSVIPSAVRKRIGMGHITVVRAAKSREELQAVLEKMKTPKRRALLGRLLQLPAGEGIDIIKLASDAGVTVPTVRKLGPAGLISIRAEVDLPGMADAIAPGVANEADIPLNTEQQMVFEQLTSRLDGGGFSVHLLHGVTGSGKTEIYLQAIRQVVNAGKQALVMVPEIALTPQTVRRFRNRFPHVAILHSGMSATQRHRYWQMITLGRAQVVVGARSAVFAPLPNLGVIVVDEEHDSSYKQDQAPRYHGRDVAIKRGQLENVPVILGSATPALETYYNAKPMADQSAARRYQYLSLPNRVRGLALPAVEKVDMRQDLRGRRGIHLISRRLEFLLHKTLDQKQQAILLLNRRGYSSFIYCPSCDEVVKCKYCDTTMTYHRNVGAHVTGGSFEKGQHSGSMQCHYCLADNPLPPACPKCGKKLSLFGLGTQRVEEELASKFPGIVFARVDSDSMRSAKDYEQLLDRFGRGEVQVMLGTQMIAKGLDYPNVTLVGVISGDTALSLPDFRAGERTFQLITQVAGRAGRGDLAGRVVVQTFQPDDPTIAAALKQDYDRFAAEELKNRRLTSLPPFTRMVRITLRDEDADNLQLHAGEMASVLAETITAGNLPIAMKGPMPCPINRIAGHHRWQIVLYCPTASPLQKLLLAARKSTGLTKTDSVAVDVDPVSLL